MLSTCMFAYHVCVLYVFVLYLSCMYLSWRHGRTAPWPSCLSRLKNLIKNKKKKLAVFHRFHTGTWQRRPSGRVPTRFIPVRVARATVTMAVLRICALLLLFDCQEAFHCCLVVACINRINMISIECHRSGERCPGKREFDNRIEINRVRSGEIMWLFPLSQSPLIPRCPDTAQRHDILLLQE